MTNARLEELRAKFQENPRRYFAPFANELRKAGDPAQAIAVCRAHLAGQPGHVSGHIVLGQALYENGEATEAREIFVAALDLDPENLIALRTLGEIAQVNGEFNTARQWYERLLDADPRNNEVSQLLKDMPAEAAPSTTDASPMTEAAEEPTPFSVHLEEKAEELEEAPRSTFHTSFTGSGRAYGSGEAETAEAARDAVPSAESSPEPSSEPFVDLEPSAHQMPPEEQVEPPFVAEAAHEAIDMVDFDAMPSAPASEFTPASAPPDEFEHFEAHAPTEDFETHAGHFEAHAPIEGHDFTSEPSVPEPRNTGADEFEEPETVGASFDSAEPASSEESVEPPRAMFAERGFDGPVVEEDLSWMTTPSAAFSDPEAAPEDWFETPPAPEAEDAAPEPRAEEAVPAEMSEPDHASDSWFDEVEGASAFESAEVTTDELWLPPELPKFAAADELPPVSAHEADVPAMEADGSSHEALSEDVTASQAPNDEVNAGWSSPDEPAVTAEQADYQPEPSWMQPADATASIDVPPEVDHVEVAPISEHDAEPAVAEPYGFDVHAMAEAADEAILVEHPVEASSAPHEEPQPTMSEAETPVEAMSMHADLEVIHASVDAGTPSEATHEVIGHAPQTAEAGPSLMSAPFITETLGELYLQQGFREEALSIFRQLVAREPENQALKDRISAIERGDVPQGSQPSEIPVEERASSQSVRTFFSRLARRPAVAPSQETVTGSSASRQTTDVPFAAAASALANLFSASKPLTSDEGAASTLAGAFSDPSGRPSRAADRELSLDHLFRDVPPGGSPSGGVTLDEFYSPNAAQGSPTEPGEATGSEEPGGTDIRQFTAWLEGLRKK